MGNSNQSVLATVFVPVLPLGRLHLTVRSHEPAGLFRQVDGVGFGDARGLRVIGSRFGVVPPLSPLEIRATVQCAP